MVGPQLKRIETFSTDSSEVLFGPDGATTEQISDITKFITSDHIKEEKRI